MKLKFSSRLNCGLTRCDVLVVALLAIPLFFLAAALPVYLSAHRRESRIECLANLRQISTVLRIWEGDTGSRMPPLESNGQTIGLNDGEKAWVNILGGSNIVRISKALQCPFDKETPTTTTVAGLKIRISYFLNLDASETYPQMVMSGDDNLVLGKAGEREPVEGFSGPAVKPGILVLSSNTLFSWTRGRHGGTGNISFADGSVSQESSLGLQNAAAYSFNGTPSLTNRIAIP